MPRLLPGLQTFKLTTVSRCDRCSRAATQGGSFDSLLSLTA